VKINKKLIRGKIKNFNWRVKWNWKIALIKGKKNQKNKGQIEKKNNKTFNWRIKLKAKNTLTKGPRKKIKIKRIRTRMKKKHIRNYKL